MNLDEYVCYESDTVKKAMGIIDRNARGVVFVRNREDALVAAVTDGDVRRFILRGGKVDEPVATLANYDFIYLFETERETADDVMREKVISAVPIVTRDMKLLDVCFRMRKRFASCEKINIPVVIMAGGKGTRLKPYTDVLPKPLIPIGNRTIVERIMDQFRNAGCEDFCMIVNYMKHFIKAYFVDKNCGEKIDFVEETEFLGTGGGLSLLKDKYQSTFFLTNCDILIDADYKAILDYHRREKNIITLVCADKNVLIPYGTIETDEHGKVIEMQEKPSVSVKVNTGLYVIEPDFIAKIQKNQKIDITDVIDQCIQSGESVGTYLISGEQWMDMGQMDELKKMQEKFE